MRGPGKQCGSSRRIASQPWFFYLAFNAVHTPVQATEKYLQRFAQIEDPKRRVYAAMLSAVDDGVGAVLGKLAETDQLDRTLVVFHNDNGGPTTRNAVNGSRNTPLRGSKCETFEGGIRVPLLMQLPGALEAGSVFRQPVISMDITATAVALAGADATGLEGVDLVPFVNGQESRPAARGVVLAVPHAQQ
jgi:arylsulfatase A-like enzyme